MQRIFRLAEDLLASQEGLCSMQLVSAKVKGEWHYTSAPSMPSGTTLPVRNTNVSFAEFEQL